jgi:hypothetical protein
MLLVRFLLQRSKNIFVGPPPLRRRFHVQDDVVEEVGKMKDELVILFLPLRPDFDECSEEKAVN